MCRFLLGGVWLFYIGGVWDVCAGLVGWFLVVFVRDFYFRAVISILVYRN